jgi:DNA-binding NarL/FixJ family response regulator
MRTVDTLIVDDHRLVRQGVTSLLKEYPSIRVVAEAEDGPSALACLREHKVDVAVVDVSMPGIGGVALARQLLSRYPEVRIIGLSMHSEPAFVDGMLQAGATGYVLKSSAIVDLATAIKEVYAGRMYLSPEIKENVVNGHRRQKSGGDSPFAVLSYREREVVQLLAEGHGTASIAELLNISPKTVASHRKKIMDSLGLENIVDLAKLALKENLITLDG